MAASPAIGQALLVPATGTPSGRHALDAIGRPDVRVLLARVDTRAGAASVGFAGSPTFTLDGVDLFDSPR